MSERKKKLYFAIWIFDVISGFQILFFWSYIWNFGVWWGNSGGLLDSQGGRQLWSNFILVRLCCVDFKNTQCIKFWTRSARYLYCLWLNVPWGLTSPQGPRFFEIFQIWPYLSPLYRPWRLRIWKDNLKILRDGKVSKLR